MRSRRAAALVMLTLGALALSYVAWRARAGRTRQTLAVEYAGCASVLSGPLCVPPATHELTLWIGAPDDAPLRFSGAQAAGAAVGIQGGRRQRVTLDPAAESVRVDSHAGSFSLTLAREPTPAWAAESRRLARAGQVEAAADLVRRSLDSAPADEQGRALGALARLQLQRGQASEATDLLRRALVDHRLRGRTLDLVNDATVLVFTLLFQERRFDEARALLASLPGAHETSAEGAYYVDYYDGLLALTTGDLRSALRALGAASRRAERLGLTRLQRTADLVLAEPLQLLGRRDEAEALLERLWREAPADLPACERAQLLSALGWNRVLVREQGEPGPDPRPVLVQARQALRSGCTELPDELRNVALNLALAHVQADDARAARSEIQAAPALGAPALHLVLWQREIEARLELLAGDPRRALARYEDLRRLAEATLAWGARWRAALGRARAWRALGRPREALLAYAEAEDRLDDDTLRVPLQEGRESFIAGHERATRDHLELLLEQRRNSEAFTLARRSRARILAALQRSQRLASLAPEERRAWDAALSEYRLRRDTLATASAEDWRLPADRLRRVGEERLATRRQLDELLDRAFALLDRGRTRAGTASRAPRAGEVLLAFHPLPQGEVGFAADARGLTVARLDCLTAQPAPAELGACLFGPFAEILRAARQVTLLPFGAFGDLDLHALPFDGAPLVAGRDVSWGLDLAAPSAAPERDDPVALLVGDPHGDLPAARREASVVGDVLRRSGRAWRIERLEGDDATYGEVRRRLARADLFHFAGHGRFTGRGGWDSVLPLAGSSALGLGDVLALERAPRLAVLSGCETGRASNEAAQSLGLAQAFLSRGALAVVAATRVVDDAAAAALIEIFYRHWSAGEPPAAALRQAQLDLRRADSHADWAAFRMLAP